MQFQAFNKILLEDQKIGTFGTEGAVLGYSFKIRYPSYRGTFLSCIEKLEFSVDGERIDPSKIVFSLNGTDYLIDELKDQYKTYWFVLDFAEIRIFSDEKLSPGKHAVTVDMLHRIPYTGYEGECLKLPSVVTKELEF